MYAFPNLEPVCCSMSSSICCFLTCIQISQEAGQVVWYSHLLRNFPQFFMIHIFKGFGIVNKAEIDVFLELPCFFDDPTDVGNLISGSSAFLKPAWTCGSSPFMYCWSLAWRILSITLLACEMSAIVWWFEHSLVLPFFGIGIKPDFFQSCGHFAWGIPWTEAPGRLQSMGSWRVRHDWETSLSLFTFMHWRRNWQPTPVFLPGESQGRRDLVGCHLWGHTELDTTEAT